MFSGGGAQVQVGQDRPSPEALREAFDFNQIHKGRRPAILWKPSHPIHNAPMPTMPRTTNPKLHTARARSEALSRIANSRVASVAWPAGCSVSAPATSATDNMATMTAEAVIAGRICGRQTFNPYRATGTPCIRAVSSCAVERWLFAYRHNRVGIETNLSPRQTPRPTLLP